MTSFEYEKNNPLTFSTFILNFDYKKKETSIDLCHNMFIYGSVLSKKPDSILEVGIGYLYVTAALYMGMKYNGKGKMTCVDNWEDRDYNVPTIIVNRLEKEGIEIITSYEEDFVRKCESDKYDFLVSDGDHHRSGLWIDEYLRIVRHDGFMFFHDTNLAHAYPTLDLINKRVKELNLPHYHFTESSREWENCTNGMLFAINKK